MRSIFCHIIMIFYGLIVFSQNSKIIIQSEDSLPIKGVFVFDLVSTSEFLTNSDGIVILPKTYTDKHGFYLYKEGYQIQKNVVLDFSSQSVHLIKLDLLSQEMDEVNVIGNGNTEIVKLQLKAVENMSLYESKKSEKIEIAKIAANLATNNNREIFAKVPGINIWESSASGLNTELGGRGLSPERSSNFNVRQNGYDISADALGYPDAYYVPPIEAVEKIEVIRGASSLQYGTQFGGMVNYVLKKPSTSTPLHFQVRQTAGSYGFSNTFLQIDGTKKKFSYISMAQYKRGNAWRDNSGFNAWFVFNKIGFQATKKLNLSLEYSFYNYLAQQAGGLTDKLFEENPQQSLRDRNFFKVNWHLPKLELNYKFSSRLKLQSFTFTLIAQRYALGFLGNITRVDPIIERDLLIDHYFNIGNETRILYKYNLNNLVNTFVVGARFYKGNTQKQQGLGSDQSNADFNYLNPENLENSDFTFPSRNISLFSENIFRIHPKFSLTPGVRLENISTNSDGYFRQTTFDLAGNVLLDTTIQEGLSKNRTFIIAGLGASYKINEEQEIYSSISQNYRAVNFNDLRILNANAQVDPNLSDEKGFNADIGYRGTFSDILAFDISAFYLYYKNRIGFTLEYDSTLFNLYRFRTNVASSRNIGLESVIEIDYLRIPTQISKDFSLKSLFNFSYIDGRYLGSKESAFRNKKVELVPSIIFKTQLSFRWKQLHISSQFSYIGEQYTDATNTEQTADAVNGKIPAYYVMDLSLKYEIKDFTLEGSINNLTNNSYFTRRASGYPGPGIIPADQRTFYLTLAYQFSKKTKGKEKSVIEDALIKD